MLYLGQVAATTWRIAAIRSGIGARLMTRAYG
jgi:hypothetical protein